MLCPWSQVLEASVVYGFVFFRLAFWTLGGFGASAYTATSSCIRSYLWLSVGSRSKLVFIRILVGSKVHSVVTCMY